MKVKRHLIIFIALGVFMTSTWMCSAASEHVNIVLNGKAVSFDENYGYPYVDENNRTMVPLRITMESAGFTVGYDAESRTAIVITDRNRIEVPIGTNKVYVDNVLIENDTVAVENNGRTYLPIRVVLEAAGYAVAWDGDTSTVYASINTAENPDFDLFTYCKDFVIENGSLNGDYCIYQQSAVNYGGYENEYFSISYWGDSDMVEFCLHCPLDETLSINFYLRMRGGFHGEYEYLSSKYYRDTGYSLRSVSGYIDPEVFSDKHPLNWNEYTGSLDGQTEFMEESRVGICDLIDCLKNFVTAEDMGCDFSAFEFVNF